MTCVSYMHHKTSPEAQQTKGRTQKKLRDYLGIFPKWRMATDEEATDEEA